jgi:ABC-type sugar transport system ATPase subunit
MLRRPLQSLFGANSRAEGECVRIAGLLGLAEELDRPVQALSGGQQQRVALGRCLLQDSGIRLLDEPLGHLDAPLRADLRREIRAFTQSATTIHVTHDPEEALAIGDQVAVMYGGAIVQIDEPAKIRRLPANRFVAELVHQATGGINFLPGVLVRDEDDVYFDSIFGRWTVSLHVLPALRESLCLGENFHARSGKTDMIVGIAVGDVRSGCDVHADDGEVSLRMAVRAYEHAVAGNRVIAANERGSWIGRAMGDEYMERGQAVTMAFSMDRAYWFDSQTGRTLVAPP